VLIYINMNSRKEAACPPQWLIRERGAVFNYHALYPLPTTLARPQRPPEEPYMPIARINHYSIRTLDHIAFSATGLAAMLAHSRQDGLPHRERTVPSLGTHQVFLEDPSQATLELNYPANETA
jgi:hypothetical protein